MKAISIAFAGLLLAGCANTSKMGWSQAEKDATWEGCQVMGEFESFEACDCLVEQLSSSITIDEMQDISSKLLYLGLDVSKLPDNDHFGTYKNSLRKCMTRE